MDTLHTVLRAIAPEKKSSPDHLTVFREFLAHLDRIQHKAPVRSASAKPPRKPSRRKMPKRGK
ncbi:MAG: hypothetical protein BGN84_10825 [Afipia sp. 62-7]|nr:hypothetical protein [Afipia sp.]OJU14920.1 MAG: hypothetical protein BGN84_10825 [Afipia sp. 62-7]